MKPDRAKKGGKGKGSEEGERSHPKLFARILKSGRSSSAAFVIPHAFSGSAETEKKGRRKEKEKKREGIYRGGGKKEGGEKKGPRRARALSSALAWTHPFFKRRCYKER